MYLKLLWLSSKIKELDYKTDYTKSCQEKMENRRVAHY